MKFPDFKKSDETKLRSTCDRCRKPIAIGASGELGVATTCNCERSGMATSDIRTDTANSDQSAVEFPDLGSHLRILEYLGEGGMGRIFKAQASDGSICAVKVLKGELSEDREALKRFEQEVDAVSTLDHPNLVAVHSRGITADGAPYLVMDYVEGGNLAGYLKKGPIKDKEILDIFLDLAAALGCAHAGGVIHRDIKPSNVLLSRSGDGQSAKLVDFGIAKLMPTESTGVRETHDLTKTGDIFGTPNYMSPEQCMGFRLDERSDIYSLGCLIYELMSGKPPFGGENPIQIVVKQISDEPPSLVGSSGSDLARGLESIVFKCLRKKPEERFQSMAELDAHLEKLRRGEKLPLHHKAVEPKAHLSRSQIGNLSALGMGSFVYAGLYLELGGSVLLLLSICVAPSLLRELYLSRKKMFLPQPEKKQWRTLRKIVFVLFNLPAVVIFAAGSGLLEWMPQSFQYVLIPVLIFQVFVFITFVASVIGEFWFGKEQRAPILTIAKKLMLISVPLSLVGLLFLPSVMEKAASVLIVGGPDEVHEAPMRCRSPRWAEALCQTTILLNKSFLAAYGTEAKLLLQLKRPQEAVEVLNRGIQLVPPPIPSEVSLLHARALSDAGQVSAALQEADKTLGAIESWNKDNVLLVKARINLEHNNLPAVITDLDNAINTVERGRDFYLLRAAAHWRSGPLGHGKALADITKCISRGDPARHMAPLYVKRAVLYGLSNAQTNAENDLHTALSEWDYSENVFAILSNGMQCLVDRDAAVQKFLIRSYAMKKLGQQAKSDQYLFVAKLLGGKKEDLLSSFASDFDIKISW